MPVCIVMHGLSALQNILHKLIKGVLICLKIIQKKPITKLNDNETATSLVGYMPSIWEKLKKKFKNSLPGMSKLIGQGLLKALPSYKPGIALANSMIIEQENDWLNNVE